MMIRAVHVLSSTERRGAQIFARDLIRASAGGRVDQHVIALRAPNASAMSFDVETLVLDTKSEGRSGPVPSAKAVHRLARAFERMTPDVIVVHGGESLKYVSLARPRTPILYRRIGQAPVHLFRGLRRRAYSVLIRQTALVIAVAEAVREETIKLLGIDPRRVVVIPNGVDSSRIPLADRDASRREIGVARDAFVILSMGALVWEKNPLAHVRVGSKALHAIPNAIHLVAGDGPMRADVERAVEGSGFAKRTKVLGSRDDVHTLLAASDVVLFLSRGSGMEGMPAVAIEAGMAGRPFVAYDIAGVSEVVLDGITGVLVRQEDESSMLDAIVRLSNDDGLSHGLGTAARRRCLELFEIKAVAERYVGAYQEVLKEARASA